MARQEFIKVRGARVHNLKNISVNIPKEKLVAVTGISGSGKSSLAFDTLYAEGQRRYVESLSAYARQFLGVMKKPDVDKIEGICPAISIDQRKGTHTPRSTVGTVTEIADYLRLLFARIGQPHCPRCHRAIARQTIDQIVDQVLNLSGGSQIVILGPVIRGKKGEHKAVLQEIQKAGFVRVRINGIIHRIEEALDLRLGRYKKHNIEVVVDRLEIEKDLDRPRLVDSLETALKLGKGLLIVSRSDNNQLAPRKSQEDLIFSEHFSCEKCGVSLPELEPRLFSFNSPFGACPACQGLGEKLEIDPGLVIPNVNLSLEQGAIFPWARASHKVGRQGFFWWRLQDLAERYNFSLQEPIKNLPPKIIDLLLHGQDLDLRGSSDFEGVIPWLERRYHQTDSEYVRQEIEKYMVEKKCEVCQGKRLKPEALAVEVAQKSIDQISEMTIEKTRVFFKTLEGGQGLSEKDLKIARLVIKEIANRLQFLIDVGVGYLSLDRRTSTLAGGEEQRVRLATQIGTQLSGILYILDEPSVGLHARDQERLIGTLKKLRDLKNTVLVVEHDPQTIMASDWIVDLGPGAGKNGGEITFEGTAKRLLRSRTLTGLYLSGKKQIPKSQIRGPLKRKKPNHLIIKGAREHNLKNITVKVPLGKFVCVTGVSGSGKSSLVNDILARGLLKEFYNAKKEPGFHEKILGTEFLNKAVLVDQSPIGRTHRSNPATYTGLFSAIRQVFSQTREARVRGYLPGRFSFNVRGGRCEACGGDGVNKIEMYFLADVFVECQECKGRRYNQETLEIEYKGKNISQVLGMTVEEALEFFGNIPAIFRRLKVLNEVGLGYIELGQPAPFLSGGEAQRVKLALELSKIATGRTLYILDEPTTGLHSFDIEKLILVLKKLVAKGNTVLIVEHNLDIIKNADWIIDLGPEGGERGGYIVVQGRPEDVVKNKKSHTGRFLKMALMS